MPRTHVTWLAFCPTLFLAALVASCRGDVQGVGDPCLPPRPAIMPGDIPCAPDAGCFNGTYVAHDPFQCRSGTCLVWQWDEAAHPEQRSARAFCSCPCGGPGSQDHFCACPSGFYCPTDFLLNNDPMYCVRDTD